MILDIIGTRLKFENLEPEKVNRFLFSKVCEFMKDNEYFHEDIFLEFLEEDEDCELAMETEKVQTAVTLSQLEEWVERAEENAEAEEDDVEELPEDDFEEAYDDDDDAGDDEDEE